MFKQEDIEIPKESLDVLIKSDPSLCDFVTKAVRAMRSDEKIRLACFSSEDMNKPFMKYLLYRLDIRRDSPIIDYICDPQTKLHQQLARFLYDEYELAKRDYEIQLASDWIASGNEKSAAAKVLSVLKKETWGDKPISINNNAPTQILFCEKEKTKTQQERVGWHGVDNFVKENNI